jgi:acyl-CoA synthetase (AMP-forming)/AMP-acid ligase II
VPPRHRKPTFANSLTPKAERKPRITPESDRDQRPVWLVERIDFDGPWCWKKMDVEALHRVHERLSAFERMTFREIEGKQNHQIPVERLGKEFPKAQPALGYGLTETNAVGCSNFWGNYSAKPDSTGRAQAPFVDLAILGAGDAHLPPFERGEIAIRSAANIKCYWENPEATAAAFTSDGYVRTGDIGYLDDDGYLFIVDRKKDIIIRGGENIACAEVEAEIYACPAVAEASVFGMPDHRLGEVPVAVIYRHEGSDLSDEELRAFLEPRISMFKIPARFIFADQPLPKLGTGKIDRVAIKAQYRH